MRAWIIVAWFMAAPLAPADCGSAAIVRDWGLHRAWRMERNCRNPQRPAVLVEMPWSNPGEEKWRESKREEFPAEPAVLSGMRVRVIRQEKNVEVQVTGRALQTGQLGETVAIRTGLGTIVHGQVRGAGVVELEPEKGSR